MRSCPKSWDFQNVEKFHSLGSFEAALKRLGNVFFICGYSSSRAFIGRLCNWFYVTFKWFWFRQAHGFIFQLLESLKTPLSLALMEAHMLVICFQFSLHVAFCFSGQLLIYPQKSSYTQVDMFPANLADPGGGPFLSLTFP